MDLGQPEMGSSLICPRKYSGRIALSLCILLGWGAGGRYGPEEELRPENDMKRTDRKVMVRVNISGTFTVF